MEYVATETSNQFVQAGFGEGTYGPETLGIIFKPAKWQEKKGLPGSTYHYAVPINIYQRMMAAKDIDAYFNDTIKAHPEQYPYTKVEADPTPPAPNGSGKATEPPSLFTSAGGADVESPVTSLAVIDTLENSALFASGGVTDAQLAAGREWYLANAPKGIETEEKRTALKRFARPLQKLRTGIEARAKEFTGETKRKLAAIDTEKRRLVLLVGGIEDEVLGPLTAWEQEEETRKMRLAGKVKMLENMANFADNPDIELLEETIRAVESYDTSPMQEYKVSAESTIVAVLKRLKPELERRKVAEAERAELERLRADAAARAEADRQAEASQMWTERVKAAVEAERKRAADAAAAEYAAMEAQAADKEHRTKVNYEAASALVAECQIDEPAAYVVIEAIAKGIIPHVTIAY